MNPKSSRRRLAKLKETPQPVRKGRRRQRRRALLLESLEPRYLLTYAAAVLADQPLAFWQMDETSGTTLVDSAPAGGALNGTYLGDPVFGEPAAHATGTSSVRFDPTSGANDSARVSNFPMTRSFTVEMWAKSAMSNWNVSGWLAAERAANGFLMHPDENSTAWRAFVVDGSGNLRQIGSHNPGSAITQWRHYVLSYDATTDIGRMYFDGVLVASAVANATNRAASANITIAGATAGWTTWRSIPRP
jgi:hypothetical protein